jgi:uncharacterized membrane-anchored protein YhcB (DUF1043 family)
MCILMTVGEIWCVGLIACVIGIIIGWILSEVFGFRSK